MRMPWDDGDRRIYKRVNDLENKIVQELRTQKDEIKRLRRKIDSVSVLARENDESHLFFTNTPSDRGSSLAEKAKSTLLLTLSLTFASISAGGVFWLLTTLL